MKKILLVKWGDMAAMGGVNLLLLNLLRHMDCSNLQVDFYVFGKTEDTVVYRAYTSMGVRIIPGNHDSYVPREVAGDLHRLIKKNHYDAVHCNTGSLSLTSVTMTVAWFHRVPVRVAHSHNTKPDSSPYARREIFFQKINTKLSTTRLACSKAAAIHLFGKTGAEICTVLKNGIVPEDYLFQPETRQRVRRELGAGDRTLVLGHIGRFERQKNHSFLLSVFAEVKKQQPDAMLLLIGTGSLMEKVRGQAEKLGVSDSVRFLGERENVSDFYQAMDAFVFPSLFEGLGIVAIEAQAADLPVICSDAVPEEVVAVASNVWHLPLDASVKQWYEAIIAGISKTNKRTDRSKDIKAAGYDISESARILFNIYSSNTI